MSNTYLGWINYAATGALSAGSANSALPISNWQVDQGAASLAWQTAPGVVTSAAGAYAVIDAGASVIWQGFVLARTNLTAAATARWRVYTASLGSPAYDTGAVSAGVVAGYGQSVRVRSAPVTGRYCRVDLDDAANPDGMINVPLAFAGPLFNPNIGPDWSSAYGRDATLDETVTRGGQEYPVLHFSRRRFDAAWQGIKSAELWASFLEFDRIARQAGNVLCVPDSSSATMAQETVFGRAAVTKDASYPAKSADARTLSFRITERL